MWIQVYYKLVFYVLSVTLGVEGKESSHIETFCFFYLDQDSRLNFYKWPQSSEGSRVNNTTKNF